jgi:GNAT superfamily N-acetyltransferase
MDLTSPTDDWSGFACADVLGIATDRAVSTPATAYEETPAYWIVRTPSRPDFWFGNYLILRSAATAASCESAWKLCASLFPASAGYVKHIVLSEATCDGPPFDWQQLMREKVTEALCHDVMLLRDDALGLTDFSSAATSIVESDDDWNGVQSLILNDAAHKERSFFAWMLRQYRTQCESGSGYWLRANDRTGRIVSTLGIFISNRGARFQHVFTEPSSRGKGYASALIKRAVATATTMRAVRSFVIVADRCSIAQRLYKGLGFEVVSTQHFLIRASS